MSFVELGQVESRGPGIVIVTREDMAPAKERQPSQMCV